MGARPSIFRRPSPPPSVDGSMAPAPPAPLRGGAGGAGAYRGKPDGPRIGPRRAACRALAPRLGLEPWRGAGPQVKAWRIGHVGTLVGPVDGLCIARHGAESPSTPGRVFARGMDASSPPRSSERAGPSSVPPPGGRDRGPAPGAGGRRGAGRPKSVSGPTTGTPRQRQPRHAPPPPRVRAPSGCPGCPWATPRLRLPSPGGSGEGPSGPSLAPLGRPHPAAALSGRRGRGATGDEGRTPPGPPRRPPSGGRGRRIPPGRRGGS